MTELLRFDAITLWRGGRLLFEQLDLELGPGDAIQVIGPNGSGKSSLIRLAAGLLSPDRGRIDRARLALADDHLALDRQSTVLQALRFWTPDPAPAIEALGLAPVAGVPVGLLSAGQAKRASLARVAASGAPLWLLDEPLNALDADGAARLAGLIDQHRSEGGAVVAASHHPLAGAWRTLELAA